MKWFKHVTTAMDDLFVKDLERKFGDAGYAYWFKTLELMGAHGEKTGVLKISWKNYCEKLNKRRDHVRRMLAFSSEAGHITFTEDSPAIRGGSPEFITITCSKFAEYADNYTKYDGMSAKRLQRHVKDTSKQEEEEVEEEVDKEEEQKKQQHAAATILPIVPAKTEEPIHDFGWLDQHLQASWGRDGRVGYSVKETLVALGKQYGHERLKYAITEAANHNARNVAYVKAILVPKVEKVETPEEKNARLRKEYGIT